MMSLCVLREQRTRVLSFAEQRRGHDDDGSFVRVRLDQMHGIEIDDVTVHVTKTALWIAGQALPHLPFHDSGNTIRVNPCATAEIRCCQPNNALRNGRPPLRRASMAHARAAGGHGHRVFRL